MRSRYVTIRKSIRILVTMLAYVAIWQLMTKTAEAKPKGDELTGPASPSGETKIKIEFCQFQVPEGLKRGYRNFSLIYSFELNRNGNPVRIQGSSRFSGEVEENEVIRCLEKWELQGLSNTGKMVAIFRWTHGRGWQTLIIIGKCFRYSIDLSGDPCPYPPPCPRPSD